MRTCYALLVAMLFTSMLNAQDFEWAYLIDNLNANEVAGLDTDDSGNVYLCGVYGDDFFLPYDGEVYLTKTDPDGEVLWTKYLGSELVVGDLVCAGDNIFIAVQSTAVIQCNGAVFTGAPSGTFMALIVIDQEDGSGFVNYYPENHGQFANLDADGDVVVLQCAGEFNSGEYVVFFDDEGNELAYHELDLDANINDIAYYDGNTYLSGHTNFPQSVVIDNVNIPAGEIDGLTFILGFDQAFVAQWGHAEDALNAQDGQVVADSSGIYSYQTTINQDFEIHGRIWKMNFEGNLINEVDASTFTQVITLYPDMAISDCHILLFAQNSFDFNNHELIMFDHDLELIDEKQIIGNSNLYSGQVTTFENQIYVSHVHTDELDFNGEVFIEDELDDAFQYPYLAKVGVGEDCGPAIVGECMIGEIFYEYHDCDGGEFYIDIEFDYEGVSESFSVFGNGNEYGTFDYGEPFYTIGPFDEGSFNNYEIIIFDNGLESCSAFIEFPGIDCGVGDCAIFDLEVFDIVCDSDSTFNFFFNAEVIDPGNNFLEVWVNEEYYGFFEIEELPIQIGGVIPLDLEWQYLEVCVNDQPDCCTALDFIAPQCPDTMTCFIGEIGYELWECVDGEFFVDIWFESNNTSDFFDVFGNGMFYGTYEYGEDFYTIGPFASGSDVVYELIVGDALLEVCVNFIEFEGIDCGIGDCEIFDLEVFDEDCDSDSTFSFFFNAEVIEPGNDFLDVWVNDEYYGFFEIDDLPIQVGGIIPVDIEWQILEVCVNDQPDCCTELAFIAPFCTDTITCVIGEVEYELWDCVDGEFYVDLWFDAYNTTDFFNVYGDGTDYGTFEYGEDYYTIGPFPSGGDVLYDMLVSDSGLDACVSFWQFEGIDCSDGDCGIFELEVFDQEANDDGTYSFVFNAEIVDPGNDFIDVWINNEYIGFFPIDDLPIVIESATPSDEVWENLLICVNDNDSCCSSVDYLRPDSIPDGLTEFDIFFSIYPNPVEDILQIELSPNAPIIALKLYDPDGRLLLRSQDPTSRRMDVSGLARGVYFLVVEDAEGNRLSRRLVK